MRALSDLLYSLEQSGGLDHARRIFAECASQVQIRRDQDEESSARQQDQPGADRQPGHDHAPPPPSRVNDRA